MQNPSDIFQVLQAIDAGKVLDISTGSGRFIKIMKEHFRSFESITGIDPDEKVLEEARNNFPEPSIQFKQMKAQRLVFDDASFDTVAISRGLHHLSSLDFAIAEMIRVLKPGGYLIIHEMYPEVETQAQETQVLMHHYRVDLDQLLGVDHFYTYPRTAILGFFDTAILSTKWVMDYVPEDMREMSSRLEEYSQDLEKLKDLPGYTELKRRLEKLKFRVRETGITNPLHLFLVKQKNL